MQLKQPNPLGLAATTCLAFAALAAGTPQANAVTADDLRERIARIEHMPEMGRGQVSVCVVDIATREVLLARQAHRVFAPASVMKVITSAAALAQLGPDYTYTTEIQTAGLLNEQGVLQGTLIIKGSGDPTLGSWRFKSEGFPGYTEWADQAAAAVKAAGITEIQGDVLADASLIDDQLIPDDWNWDDIGNYYAAGVAGVNLHENLYHLDFEVPRRVGLPTRIKAVRPPQTGVAFHNKVTAGEAGTGDRSYIYSAPYSNLAVVRGTLGSDAGKMSIRGAIQDPPLFAARELLAALQRAGIEVTGQATGTFQSPRLAEGERQTIWSYQSPSLERIAYWVNKQSVNLYAEALTLTMAVETGRPGKTTEGTAATLEILNNLGVNTIGMILADGSGLARRNAVSARQVVHVLERMTGHPSFAAFEASLPIAGVADDPGGLARTGLDTPAANNLRAKSGFIGHTRAYAGYVTDASGRKLAFCIMANRFPGSSGPITEAFKAFMLDLARLEADAPAPAAE
ncbi:D-alanyl-D-alanine carboxypeptidase/D-alanyl-D-alanine endopeptidase [Mucisphaera sp.]|uniref:D-alanyl-D-alanine carboxypeptidase/D-alanyl-D-alanine endopeptidase n=1 Tax=Mucisphaera sp. TaxID=2913024 RepID=UPI003D0B18F5